MSKLRELLRDREEAIARRWVEGALQVYAPNAAALFDREKDPFANPVGHALRTGTQAVVKGLAAGEDDETVAGHLADVIQMRAVQDAGPSQALAFVPLLKTVVRAELGERANDPVWTAEWMAFDGEIDRVTLRAFDRYVKCREQVAELRINEVKRSVSVWLEMGRRGRPEQGTAPGKPDSDACAT